MFTLKVKVQLSWYAPLVWLRLRIRLSQSNIAGLSKGSSSSSKFKKGKGEFGLWVVTKNLMGQNPGGQRELGLVHYDTFKESDC